MDRLKKVWKFLKKLCFWVFFISLFFVTVITVVIHVYEDDIKQFAISELNGSLKANVEVQNMEVTIFKDFPNASIGFERVFIADAYETIESKDTLLFAEALYFHFNLWDIWTENYKVKRASIHHGKINLKTTKSGEVNYNIVAETNDSIPANEQFSFVLDLLKVEDVNFCLYNQSTGQDYNILIQDALARGDFGATKFQLLAQGDLQVNKLKSGSLTLIADKKANLDLALNIDTEAKSYAFEKGDLSLEEMEFVINGQIDSANIDLNITGKKIGVAQLVKSLVPEDEEQTKEYQGDGIVNFEGSVTGPLSRQEMPSIQASFSVENGAIVESDNNLKIDAVNVVGNYQNGFEDREEKLDFTTFSFRLLNSAMKGTGTLTNFDQPLLTTKIQGDMDLAAFHQFFAFKQVEELAGNVKLNLDGIIQFFDPEYRKDKFEIMSSNGDISLSNVVYKGVDSRLRFANISGDILVNQKDAAAQNLSIKTAKSDLLLNGAMKNLVGYIEGSGNLGLIASLESNNIDLDEFLGPANKNKEGPLTMFQLPVGMNLNIDMHVANFLWDGHTFNDITGQFLLANRKVTVNRMKMKTLGGAVSGKLVLNNLLENGNIIDGNINFSNVNIKKLFAEWDNFKQSAITDEHISGTVSGNVNVLLLFNPYFSIVEDQIVAVSDILIKNGQLNNLETMKSITDYMRSNKALKLMLNKHIDNFEKQLLQLNFSEIKNKLEIKERRLTIPKMTIKSNALDVDLFGWHDFDNNIEYHFSFRFRQLKSKPEYTEFGRIEDDGTGLTIYMTMFGSIDEPQFSLDSEERKNDIKETIDIEKSTVKSMLKSEFGLFQKDSTIKSIEKDNKKEVEFIYYETDIETDSIDTSKEKVKNKKRTNKFFEKLKQEAEKDKESETIETEL